MDTEDTQLILYLQTERERFYRIAYSYVRNRETALDLVQESIVKALQKQHTIRNSQFLRSWFYRILVNHCLSHVRRTRHCLAPISLECLKEEIAAEAVSNEGRELYFNIQRLTPDLKTVVLLRFFEELSLLEIAAITSLRLSTVKARLYRALRLLRQQIEQENGK